MDDLTLRYFDAELELNQTLDREHAIEMLHSCWLKLLEVNKIRSGIFQRPDTGFHLVNFCADSQHRVDKAIQFHFAFRF